MNQIRRLVFRAGLICSALLGLSALVATAHAQDYPARPVRIFVGYPPGGTTDSITRVLAQGLQERLGQSVLVENRPGASTQIATDALIRSAPDGSTLQIVASDITILPTVRKRVPWNVTKDFTPIARIATSPLVYTANVQLPVKTLQEFVAYAKARPGAVRYGSGGTGSILHLVGELLRANAGIDLVHVPYKGGAPIVQDLLGKQIEMGVLGPIDVAPRMDKVRALAQTGQTRHPLLPTVPTTTESGFPAVSPVATFTLVGPANLPRGVVDRLTREIALVMERPDFRQRANAVGAEPALLTGVALEKFLADDAKTWDAVAKASKISLDD